MLGEFKTDDGQTHVHATFWRFTYIRPSSVGIMDTSTVEPPYVGRMATLEVTVTATLFLVPNSLFFKSRRKRFYEDTMTILDIEQNIKIKR